MKYAAMGVICGVGSMLIGARKAGFKVVGNVDWRPYYHTGTFEKNFPQAFMVKEFNNVDTPKVDLIMGHTECGNYSQLNLNRADMVMDQGDIPIFVHYVQRITPRFFVMDNLPMSLLACDAKYWIKAFPDYDIFFEWISNYNYGNLQKNRNRMFVIGAKKSEKFVFVPGEEENRLAVNDVIGDLLGKEGKVPNHYKHTLNAKCGKAKDLNYRGHVGTWKDVQKYFKKSANGRMIKYHASGGIIKGRPGFYKTYWDKHTHILDGGSPLVHPKTCLPLSPRERLRIQGAPDSFVLVGAILEKDGTWNHDKNNKLVKQTGKFMPVQFCTYIAKQIMAHIRHWDFECSGQRLLPPNKFVTKAKMDYCRLKGYKHQKKVCEYCGHASSCPRRMI
jgi:site-specific DNA-cytosine methylase